MRAVGSAWERSLRRAGIEAFRFHDLRHTWASWHVMSGTSLQELMELGGWKSFEMVLRYARDGASLRALGARASRDGRAADRAGLGSRGSKTPRFPHAEDVERARSRVSL
jgi:integrase